MISYGYSEKVIDFNFSYDISGFLYTKIIIFYARLKRFGQLFYEKLSFAFFSRVGLLFVAY